LHKFFEHQIGAKVSPHTLEFPVAAMSVKTSVSYALADTLSQANIFELSSGSVDNTNTYLAYTLAREAQEVTRMLCFLLSFSEVNELLPASDRNQYEILRSDCNQDCCVQANFTAQLPLVGMRLWSILKEHFKGIWTAEYDM